MRRARPRIAASTSSAAINSRRGEMPWPNARRRASRSTALSSGSHMRIGTARVGPKRAVRQRRGATTCSTVTSAPRAAACTSPDASVRRAPGVSSTAISTRGAAICSRASSSAVTSASLSIAATRMKQAAQNHHEDEALLSGPMTDDAAASTGVATLDAALDGLYWGDNVVWETETPAAVEPFYAAVAGRSDDYDLTAYVALARAPEEIAVAYPGFEAIDARP